MYNGDHHRYYFPNLGAEHSHEREADGDDEHMDFDDENFGTQYDEGRLLISLTKEFFP